jgi:hypothetical protein
MGSSCLCDFDGGFSRRFRPHHEYGPQRTNKKTMPDNAAWPVAERSAAL